jgi:hypothetical protein
LFTDVNPSGAPRLEISQSGEGSVGNIEHTEIWAYWTERRSDDTYYGDGIGAFMTKDESSEVVSVKGQGIGRMTESGSIRNVGSNFYSTTSTGRFAFLNSAVCVFEYNVDSEINFTGETWEWK